LSNRAGKTGSGGFFDPVLINEPAFESAGVADGDSFSWQPDILNNKTWFSGGVDEAITAHSDFSDFSGPYVGTG
jgi:hypothetical protein